MTNLGLKRGDGLAASGFYLSFQAGEIDNSVSKGPIL